MARYSATLLSFLAALALLGGAAQGQTISIVSGNGQVTCPLCLPNPNPFFDNLVVVVKDAAGNAVPNYPVTFSVSGLGTISGAQSLVLNTGTDGTVSVPFAQPVPLGSTFGLAFTQSTITATAGASSVQFVETTLLTDPTTGVAQVPSPQLVSPTIGTTLTGQSGQVSTTPIQVRVGTLFGTGVPGVEVKLVPLEGNTVTAVCQSTPGLAPGTVLTDATGTATCNVVFGGVIGFGQFNVQIGNKWAIFGPLSIQVTPGLPCAARIINASDRQTANAGQMLPAPLIARIEDCGGNPLSNIPVAWTVSQGSGTLINTRTVTDANGQASTNLTPGPAGGNVQVTMAVAPGTQTATGNPVSVQFNFTIAIAVTALQKLSGDGQTGVQNQAFPQALTVQVNNGAQPVPGVAVQFAVASGSVTLSASSAITDAQGRASVTATAGPAAGPAAVTATIQNLSVTFNLTVRPPGPSNIAFLNGAGFQRNFISPCSIATITGQGIATGIQGVVAPSVQVGPLPLTVAGVTVQFGEIFAPIYSVANQSGQESVTVQVPCEIQPGNVLVTIRVGQGSGQFTAAVLAVAPGLFETTLPDNRRQAVLLKPDGTFVSPVNPARRGEIIRTYVTGIGNTTPALPTNSPGLPAQESTIDITNIVVGVAGAGVRVVSARHAPGLIGVSEVAFELPSDAPMGTQPFVVAVAQGGSLVFSNPSIIPVQ
ncbi:MAG: Ig-like domain-containing protein [Bryobacteraceae bacterium]